MFFVVLLPDGTLAILRKLRRTLRPVKIKPSYSAGFISRTILPTKKDSYLQSASELSVANYIKARQVADFEINKPVVVAVS